MQLLVLFIVTFLGCAVTLNAQTPSDRGGVKMTMGQDKFFADLQLHTNLIKLETCSGDRLRFTLRLNYVNEGKGIVILDKRSSVISNYMISRNFENAVKKKYEIEVPRLIGLDAAGMTMESVPDESQFVLLKPGEVYSFDQVFNLYIRAELEKHRSRRGGLNFLQMVVLTWYYPRASNSKWRDQWRTKGYLWSDPIISIPMPFKLGNNTSVVDCPNKAQVRSRIKGRNLYLH